MSTLRSQQSHSNLSDLKPNATETDNFFSEWFIFQLRLHVIILLKVNINDLCTIHNSCSSSITTRSSRRSSFSNSDAATRFSRSGRCKLHNHKHNWITNVIWNRPQKKYAHSIHTYQANTKTTTRQKQTNTRTPMIILQWYSQSNGVSTMHFTDESHSSRLNWVCCCKYSDTLTHLGGDGTGVVKAAIRVFWAAVVRCRMETRSARKSILWATNWVEFLGLVGIRWCVTFAVFIRIDLWFFDGWQSNKINTMTPPTVTTQIVWDESLLLYIEW